MPAIPANLFTRPNDVFDYLGAESTQLRLDDHRQATGQTITLTADAAVADVSVSILPLRSSLLRGTVLVFDGGGMPAQSQVALSAVALVGAMTLSVVPLADALLATASAPDTGVNTALAARLVKGCYYGTGQVKLYCCPRYDESELVKSWSVNRWATTLAARWVAKRLSRPCPQSIESDCEEAMEEMKGVKNGQLNIEEIGTRTAGWPFITNTTIDLAYSVRKVRVEPAISEGTPTQYPQAVDWNSAWLFER